VFSEVQLCKVPSVLELVRSEVVCISDSQALHLKEVVEDEVGVHSNLCEVKLFTYQTDNHSDNGNITLAVDWLV